MGCRQGDLGCEEVIFSGEKKFNLEVPHGWASYWHHIGMEQRIEKAYSTRQSYGVVSVCCKCDLVILERKKSEYYCSTLKNSLLF